MAIRDIEDLLVSIKDYLKNNINTYIDAINTQKLSDDSTTFQLDNIPVDNKNFLFAVNREDLPNRTFVMIGLADNFEISTNRNIYSSNISVDIEVIFQNPHKDYTGLMAFRYMQALINTMINYESSIIEIDGLDIVSSLPMEVTINRRQLITSRITVSTSLA